MPSEEMPLQSHPALLTRVSAQLPRSEPMRPKPCRQLDLITVPSLITQTLSLGPAAREAAFAVGLHNPSSLEPQP